MGTYKNIVILFYADSKNLNLPSEKYTLKRLSLKIIKKILFQVFVFCVYCVTKKLPFQTYVF